jgi:dihydrofolate reductase
MSAHLTLIAAVSADGFISRGKGVPWDLPLDRAQFRAYTEKKWLLIGRRTYEEMQGWFKPGQHPLVLTRGPQISSESTIMPQTVHTVSQALLMAQKQPELVCCGGAEIYAAAMPYAQRLVITHVHDFLGSGLPFPAISLREWETVSRQSHGMDAEHASAFDIVTYQRIRQLDLAA